MICRHKLRRGKSDFATVKWYNLCLQIIQSQTCYPLTLWHDHIQWLPLTDQTLYRTELFTEFWEVAIEHWRRVWHADRGRFLLRTPGPVPYVFYLLRTILFPNLSLFFRTMLFEYPSVLSQFCLNTTSNTYTQRHKLRTAYSTNDGRGKCVAIS